MLGGSHPRSRANNQLLPQLCTFQPGFVIIQAVPLQEERGVWREVCPWGKRVGARGTGSVGTQFTSVQNYRVLIS